LRLLMLAVSGRFHTAFAMGPPFFIYLEEDIYSALLLHAEKRLATSPSPQERARLSRITASHQNTRFRLPLTIPSGLTSGCSNRAQSHQE
jgi:hypothetical protein